MPQKKILIIDDSPDVLEFTKRILEHRGYAVTAMDDSKNILAAIKTNRPDLIILDMFLANTTGLEIFRQIKSDAVLHEIPVIITTGHLPDQETETDPSLLQPDAYLNKPFEVEDLIDTIKKFIG